MEAAMGVDSVGNAKRMGGVSDIGGASGAGGMDANSVGEGGAMSASNINKNDINVHVNRTLKISFGGLLPLQVAVNRDGLRLFLARKHDKAFEPFCRTVWQRDDYCCRYCGFRSGLHQEVVNIDGDYLNNRISNLATACRFCQQSMFLSSVGGGVNSGGKLIWMPEMTQGQLNSLVHVLFSMMHRGGRYGGLADGVYQDLMARSNCLSKSLNLDIFSDAGEFGRYLLDLGEAASNNLQKSLFSRVRLLPIFASFAGAVKDWEQETQELMK